MDAFPYLFQTSVLLLALSAGYYLLLRRETFFQANRLLLWFSLMGALLLPLIELPDFRPEPVRRIVRGSIEKIQAAPQRIPLTVLSNKGTREIAVGQRVRPQQPFNWPLLLTGLYGIVASVLLIRFLVQLRSLLRLINRSTQEAYEGFWLVMNETIKSPFSFFKWVVLNPAQHTPDEQEQILRHERIHVRQWHSLDTLAAEVLCIVLWFNPGAWLFRRLVHQTLEYIADQAVLQEGVDARSYQYNLVKVTLAANSPTISNHFSRSELKNRIAMMNQRKSRWYAWFKYPLLVFIALAVATAFIQPKVPIPVQAVTRLREVAKPILAFTHKEQATPVSAQPDTQSLSVADLPVVIPAAQPTIDSIKTDQAQSETSRPSRSKYLHYQNNTLYWLVTPKTSFEDLVIIKNELAKHNYQFQLLELKKDPLGEYIHFVRIKVLSPGGGSGEVDFVPTGVEPTPSKIGYVSLKGTSLGVAESIKTDMMAPERLQQVAITDETAANAFYQSHRVDYLVEEGTKLRYGFGGYSMRIETSSISLPNSITTGLEIKSDGSFTITDNERLRFMRFFLNNEAYNTADIEQLKIGQIEKIILVRDSWSSPPKAIFLYTKP